jgi:hypothetical protein
MVVRIENGPVISWEDSSALDDAEHFHLANGR